MSKDILAQTDTFNFGSAQKKERYFYEGLTYGSQGNFNPVSLILNRGFEMLRITTADLAYDPFHYHYRFENIFENLSKPVKYVRLFGTKDFFLEQVVPFGNSQKPYWYPNYTLHLIGGGITYTGLKEWYVAHQVPAAGVLSAATVLSAALINEAIEERQRGGNFILNVDAVADVWIFDLGGILLFQSEGVNRFFSQKLHMRDWSRQPMLLLPGTFMGNCGQFFSVKLKVPRTKNWYLFSLMGLGGLVGVSHTFKDGYAWSIGFGQGPHRKEKELFGLPIDVSLVPMAGIYLDKNNSVLASLEMSNSPNDKYHNYFVELNIYPGLIRVGKKFSPGVWSAFTRQNQLILGINCNYTFGLGIGRRPA
ncbi:MAG: hypothetical protein SGJ00_12950 [bacterium]|nr:hypothetical protein [bacterium]